MPFGAPLRGCIPILVTPFRDGGSLDLPSLLGTVERGAVGALPTSNIKRYFAEVQHLLESGDRAAAERRFATELAYVLWR